MLVDEVEYFRILVDCIVGLYEQTSMIIGSYKLKVNTTEIDYRKIMKWIKDGARELKGIAFGNVDPKLDMYLTDIEQFSVELDDAVGQLKYMDSEQRFRQNLDKLTKIDSRMQNLIGDVLDHIREIRVERKILEESQSQRESIYFPQGGTEK